MQFGFITENLKRGKAALILYAIYRSRPKSSSLNGIETWNRFTAYIRGACLKSENTAQFINVFCKMAGVGSIKPCFLESDGGMIEFSDGSIIIADRIKEYKIDLIEDDTLMNVFENEGQMLVMLIRERIQREKMEGVENEETEDQL